MADDVLEKLQTISPEMLTFIVRQDKDNPFFEVTKWSVRRLSDKGIANPDGLWLFNGQGINDRETQPWSVVLKILKRQEEETSPDNLWYWKREYLLAQSGLTGNLPVKAPRFYYSEELPEGAWIWMEHMDDLYPGQWTLDNYSFAAHQLGIWNGSYLNGTSLPKEDWLAREHYRAWLGWMNCEEAWQFPLNQKLVSGETMIRHKHLWNERERFFRVLENLPQVFSHFDCQRRNLIIRTGNHQQNQLVALDWQQCGIGAIGAELSWLVGMSTFLLEWPSSDLPKLSEVVFHSYVKGLQESGWSGDADIACLGYKAMLAVFIGCAFPALTAIWCSAENREFALQILGSAEESLFWQVLPILDFSLDCADESQVLVKKLGLGI